MFATRDRSGLVCFSLVLLGTLTICPPSTAAASGPLIVASQPPVLTAENGVPANSVAEPGERVTVDLSLLNVGSADTVDLVATLLPTGGVTIPSGPQRYGVVVAGGAAVTRSFSLTAAGNCGDTITLSLALQDGATDLGSVTYTMILGALTPVVTFAENFDGVTPTALPPGWSTAASGVEVVWVSSTTSPSSAPNDAFAPDVSNIGNTTLDSPTINVPPSGGQLTFRNLFNMEASGVTLTRGFDGMVLEISVNGGVFSDITSGGNAFIAGGYTRTIDSTFGSSLSGRQAWSGLSGGTTAAPTYITSTINLPAAAAGQPVQLRWRAATDNSAVAAGATGVRVDSVSLSSLEYVCSAVSPQSGFYFTVPGCRVIDTRLADGPTGGPALAGGATRTFVVAGSCGVPASALAVALNVTVTGTSADGSLKAFQALSPPPIVDVVSWSAAQTRANDTITRLGAAGDVSIQNGSTSGCEVIVDVLGYFE